MSYSSHRKVVPRLEKKSIRFESGIGFLIIDNL